jgi:hypothetical protein
LSATAAGSGAFAQGGARSVDLELYIEEIYERKIGDDISLKIGFRDPLTRQINPALRVHEGDAITIKLVNRTRETRSFAIMSVPGTKSAPIKAGTSAVLRFTAPSVGGYIYHDPLQSKLNEARSLFGDFVVTQKPKRDQD